MTTRAEWMAEIDKLEKQIQELEAERNCYRDALQEIADYFVYERWHHSTICAEAALAKYPPSWLAAK